MDPDEIQTLILAYISGVNEEKMLTNTTTLEEKRLIRIAANLMKEYSSNFIIEKISNPSISTVRSKITNYILRDNINYIFYDYIFTSPALNFEFSRTGLREDVTLMMLANTLKEIASDYHVFIYTGTQVNREWEKRSFRNENSLAGSKAIADKADFGCVGVKVLEEEYQKIEVLVREGNYKQPNMVLDIYKNRRGRITTTKLYRIFDHGTCRTEDLFITDTNFRLLEGIGIVEYDYKVKDLLEMAVDNRSEQNGKN
jgi:replicative DNA helicase